MTRLPRSVTAPRGFRAAGGTCGIKPSGKPDLALIVADGPCDAAGVFTRNKVKGAPVIIGRRHLKNGSARAVLCNSGIANVATGQRGLRDAIAMCKAVADELGFEAGEVLPNSTGVIGPRLPVERITGYTPQLVRSLARGAAADAAVAQAILTTDLVPKAAKRTVQLGQTRVTIGGVAKGSGMIAPNMATMLVFITTDAAIAAEPLQQALKTAVDQSFNRMSIDSDTSTSDSVCVLANGEAGNRKITRSGRQFDAFADALTDLGKDLAYQIVQDGEGAEKVFRVRVTGARSVRDADKVGRAVVDSPLVKTAVHGGDPNWGRILMATGKSGASVKPERVTLSVGGVRVFEPGGPIEITPAVQNRLERAMAGREVVLAIDLGLGEAGCEWLGCDLSRQYVAINADYTT